MKKPEQNICHTVGADDTDPPISLTKFTEMTGLSAVTIWRLRKKGFLKTYGIANRQYLSRSDIAEFNRRLKAGEFAGKMTGAARTSQVFAAQINGKQA